MYVVTRCLEILSTLAQNGEGVHAELCKIPSLPASLASFIERLCDNPDARFVFNPKILVEDLIKLLCTIVMKACSSGRLKPSGSSDHSHAQSLRSMCMRLLARFKPHPSVAAVRPEGVAGGAVEGGRGPASQPSISVTMPGSFLFVTVLLVYYNLFIF